MTAAGPAAPSAQQSAGAARRLLCVSLFILVADQLSKFAIDRYTDFSLHRVLIPGFAALVHHCNPGAAFGLFADLNSRWVTVILITIPLIASVVFCWLLISGRLQTRLSRWGIALLLGGTLGNLAGRIVHGCVIDFLLLYAGRYHWPAFNVADSAVVIGALLFLADSIRESRRQRPSGAA